MSTSGDGKAPERAAEPAKDLKAPNIVAAKTDAAPKPTPKPRPEFRHPVLSAMGISRLRVPSRNWSIFWLVTGTILGGVWYDRRERNKVREAWKERVRPFAEVSVNPLDVPRKVRVFVAPPPNDFLDVTLKHFRQYVKPVLTAAAVDHEIISENQQGHIRTVVAEEIRNKRREAEGLPTTGPQPDEIDQRIESKISRDLTGGVICVGRGAYKEYMAGLQEGWMGPLEEPQFVRDDAVREAAEKARKAAEAKAKKDAKEKKSNPEGTEPEKIEGQIVEGASESRPDTADLAGANDAAGSVSAPVNVPGPLQLMTPGGQPVSPPDAGQATPASENTESSAESEDGEKSKELRIASWLRAEHYPEASVAPQFDQERQEPIAVVRHPHLLGFLNTPWRIVRYFNQRKLADEMGKTAYAVVVSTSRPYTAADADLAKSDESDWPSKWKQNGEDVQSEWMRAFAVDPRIAERLEVYTFTEDSSSAN